MRINNSIRTTVLPVTTQLLNFLPGLQVIMRMCHDPEAGLVHVWKTGLIHLSNNLDKNSSKSKVVIISRFFFIKLNERVK